MSAVRKSEKRMACMFEQVAHPGGTDAHEHLDEFRAADREDEHAGLAGRERLTHAVAE